MAPAPDADVRVSRTLAALASPTRVALMRALRRPRILAEIEVRPPGGPPRPLARQTVRQHLDTLLAAGLVVARGTERDRGETYEFLVNHQAIYALGEEVRGLARLRPLVEPDAATAHGEPPERALPPGPCLVLVKGLDEGAAFPLAPGRDAWVIGRRRDADVPLDFDPFVSGENARVTRQEG
ncbi:MAG TPA: hypothetical protein VNX21_02685, partial [Candidatus Thermoplasmatota archaeon]|nr:hypothetical protein [Candidatus Thermoplasmatota archaeon]